MTSRVRLTREFATPVRKNPYFQTPNEIYYFIATVINFPGLEQLEQPSSEKVFNLRVNVETILEPCTYPVIIQNGDDIKMCPISVEILPQMLLEEIQISLLIPLPLKITPSVHYFGNLIEKTFCISYAYLYENFDIPTLEVDIVATAVTGTGVPKCITESMLLPLKLIAGIGKAQKEAEHKVTLTINQNPVPLAVMFSGQ